MIYGNGKDIEKTFGLRIPVSEYTDYYITTLLKSPEKADIKEQILLLKELAETSERDLADLKGKLIYDSVQTLKERFFAKLSLYPISELKNELELKQFIPEHGKRYISFDIKEANWSVIKHYLGLDFNNWVSYSQEHLNFPKAIAYSKPIRQAILGQVVNPKLYDKMQKCLTAKHLDLIEPINIAIESKIVGVNSEEVILEIDPNVDPMCFDLPWIVPVKTTVFDVNIVRNYGDTVIVKTIISDKGNYKSLYAVDGKRFYIHFKTLILDEPLDVKDLLFKIEHKIFEYCGTDLKDFKEYDYVRKHIKKIDWLNNFGSIDGNLKYVIEQDKFIDVDIQKNIYTKSINIKNDVEEYHYNKIKSYIS